MLKKQTLTTKEASQKIAKFCAYQERCHQEVRDKLFSYGLFKDDVEMIIYELTQQDFLNEERFALAFARIQCLTALGINAGESPQWVRMTAIAAAESGQRFNRSESMAVESASRPNCFKH